MNVSAVDNVDWNGLLAQLKRSNELAEMQALAEPPMKDGKVNPAWLSYTLSMKNEKILASYETERDKAVTFAREMNEVEDAHISLESAMAKFSRTIVTKKVSATDAVLGTDTGVTGIGSVRAVSGDYNLSVKQVAEKCRFTFDGLNAAYGANAWTSDGDIACSDAINDQQFYLNAHAGAHLRVTEGGDFVDITLVAGENLAETVETMNDALDANPNVHVSASIQVYDGNKRRIVLESALPGQAFTVSDTTGHATMFDRIKPVQQGASATVVQMHQLDGAEWTSANVMNTHANWPEAAYSAMKINGVAITFDPWLDPAWMNASDYLNDFVTRINEFADETGVIARRVQVAGDATTYVEFARLDGGSGIEIDANPIDGAPLIAPSCFRCTASKTNSVVEYAGGTFSASSATMSDVIPGIDLDLTNAQPGDVKVSVAPGKDWESLLNEFAKAYDKAKALVDKVDNNRTEGNRRASPTWNDPQFQKLLAELGTIETYKTVIAGTRVTWQDLGVSFANGKMNVQFPNVASSADKAQQIEDFLSGTGSILTVINPAGANGSIFGQTSTLGRGAGVSLLAGNTYAGELNGMTVVYNGGDKTDAGSYAVTLYDPDEVPYVDGTDYTVTINATDPNNIVLDINGAALAGLALRYRNPPTSRFNAGYTNDVFFSYAKPGDVNASRINLDLLSGGNNIANLSQLHSIIFKKDSVGGESAYAIYNGTIVDVDAVTNLGGGVYELEFTTANTGLEGVKIKYTSVGNDINNGQAHVFSQVAFGSGLGIKDAAMKRATPSFTRAVDNAINARRAAQDEFGKKASVLKAETLQKVVIEAMKTMMGEADLIDNLLESMLS